MARIRTLAGGIVAWIALATTSSAAPVSWFDSQAALTAWYANQINNSGSIYSPGSSTSISNLPFNWYRPAAAAPAAAAAAAPAPAAAAPTPVSTFASDAAAAVSTESAASAVQRRPIQASAITPVPGAFSPAARFNAASIAATPVAATPSNEVDAFVNLGATPYAGASSITVGNAQPWYTSPSVAAVYGGTPNADQQASFEKDVLAKVQQTFALSGLDVKLTADPNVPAEHMLSVVSGASYGPNPDAIGITQVGGNGFSFIDKLNYAANSDQLTWAVAHNVAHELMHGLGVGTHPDTTGDYIDAGTASWKLLTDPNAQFSPAAVSLIKSAMANGTDLGGLGAEILKSGVLSAQCGCRFCGKLTGGVDGEQVLATPVPEPATIAVWAAGLLGGLALHRRRLRAA